ncbi:class I SAM-dependent methyltransferase [Nocardia higoensis]|uniref:class I SAM-dependent methyltransferase n=1 Tax=Nocardia higoensis TaxID=228599 RepID=UPI0005928C19|nr:methyltransferase domain-containing protein [Nocardia higoensis]
MSTIPLSAARAWDLAAQGYAAFSGELMTAYAARALELVEVGAGDRVLDLASGPGSLALLAAPRVAEVQAIDFSEEMLRLLRARAEADGIGNIEARLGDGQKLPYADEYFDAAFSMFGLMFFPDRRKGFAEMFRVLRPGGVAVVSSWAPASESTLMRTMYAALCATGAITEEPQPVYSSLENPEVFASEMRDAGFAGVSIQRHTSTLSWPSSKAFLDHMLRGSAPMTLLRHDLGEQEWQRCEAVMRAYVDEHYRPNAPLTTTALLGIAHRPRNRRTR